MYHGVENIVIYVGKTEEIIFNKELLGNHLPIMINNEPVRQVPSYKYLGLINFLGRSMWISWGEGCNKKSQTVWSCSEGHVIMPVFNLSLYGVVAWFGNLKATARSQLHHLFCTAKKVVGLGFSPVFSLFLTSMC